MLQIEYKPNCACKKTFYKNSLYIEQEISMTRYEGFWMRKSILICRLCGKKPKGAC